MYVPEDDVKEPVATHWWEPFGEKAEVIGVIAMLILLPLLLFWIYDGSQLETVPEGRSRISAPKE